MRASTLVIGIGALLFVLPAPGTFVLGGIVAVAGVAGRALGF